MTIRFLFCFVTLFLAEGAFALNCKSILSKDVKAPVITSRNFKKSVRYIKSHGLKIPYVDLKPTGKSNGKTVLLIAGFSKNMRSWLPHMRLLTAKGYRVVSYDQTNVGYNLFENGVLKLDKGTGLDTDSILAMDVLKTTGVTKNLSIMGHSRGGAVAARLALMARGSNIGLDRVLLLMPYVRYIWTSQTPLEAFGESMYDISSEFNPQYYGKFLYDRSKVKKYEVIDELSDHSLESALVYVLKGLKLNEKAEVSTKDVLDALLKLDKNMQIDTYAGEHDLELAPPKIVSELESKGINYSLFKGKTKDHYWPLHYAESMLKEVGLL